MRAVKWMVAVMVIVPLMSWFVAAVVTYTMPKLYESQATIELLPSGLDVEAWGVDQYMETELQVMRSNENLIRVSQQIQLEERWAMAEQQVVEQLKRAVKVQRVGQGRIIRVTCRHRMKADAQAVCQAVYTAYQYRKADLSHSRGKTRMLGLIQDDRAAGNQLEELALEYAHVSGTYQGDLEWVGVKREVEVVRRDLEAAEKKKKALEAELVEERRKMATPVEVMLVHEVPQIGHNAVSPNIRLNLAMGLMVGVVGACLIDGVILLIVLTRASQ